MKTLYYDRDTGYICEIGPLELPKTETSIAFELEDKVAEQLCFGTYGKAWAVIDNKLVQKDVPEIQNTLEYRTVTAERNIMDLEDILMKTDYVVLKLNEAKVEQDEDEYNYLLSKYADVLSQRKQARSEIRFWEAKLEELHAEANLDK